MTASSKWQGRLLTDGSIIFSTQESFRSVLICDREHTRSIWAHGAYGCSTRSTRFKPAFMEKRKRKRFVGDDDDVEPETMQLNLMEALYLVGKDLLIVSLNERELSEQECLEEFKNRYSNDILGFACRYQSYKSFREAGWIPKTGTQYGSHYVLYAMDPDHCHSKFCVTLHGRNSSQIPVTGLMRMMRVAEQTRKRSVLCDDDSNCVQFRRWVLKQDGGPNKTQAQQKERARIAQAEKRAKKNNGKCMNDFGSTSVAAAATTTTTTTVSRPEPSNEDDEDGIDDSEQEQKEIIEE